MKKLKNLIKTVNNEQLEKVQFEKRFVSCVVVTQENQIIMQQRGEDFDTYPGYITNFGGCIEKGEKPLQTLIRELNEELGAQVKPQDVISFGAITEAITKHTELIYPFFWHDKNKTITGCYEGEMLCFDHYDAAVSYLSHYEKVMDDVWWILNECRSKKLI